MTLIFPIDTRLGLSFLGKRQSRDRALTADIVHLLSGRRLLIRESSRMLFDEAGIGLSENGIQVTEEPFESAGESDCIFWEGDITDENLLSADELIIFCWGRHYPSDKKLKRELTDANFTLAGEYEFCGNSHENLTRYTLKRKN